MRQRLNRRRFERFATSPMYTPLAVRLAVAGGRVHEGHAYDISEGGVRFELDDPIAPGTPIEITITLPGATPRRDRSFAATGQVVWSRRDPDEPGPTQMAAVFTRFAAADRARLVERLAGRRGSRAA